MTRPCAVLSISDVDGDQLTLTLDWGKLKLCITSTTTPSLLVPRAVGRHDHQLWTIRATIGMLLNAVYFVRERARLQISFDK